MHAVHGDGPGRFVVQWPAGGIAACHVVGKHIGRMAAVAGPLHDVPAGTRRINFVVGQYSGFRRRCGTGRGAPAAPVEHAAHVVRLELSVLEHKIQRGPPIGFHVQLHGLGRKTIPEDLAHRRPDGHLVAPRKKIDGAIAAIHDIDHVAHVFFQIQRIDRRQQAGPTPGDGAGQLSHARQHVGISRQGPCQQRDTGEHLKPRSDLWTHDPLHSRPARLRIIELRTSAAQCSQQP